MTFRKEDMLPYEVVKPEKTPEYLKTIMMQWSILEPYWHNSLGHDTYIDPKSLLNMSQLDRNTDDDHFAYGPTGFSSVFKQAIKENSNEEARAATRRVELWKLCGLLFLQQNIPMCMKVEELITEELRDEQVSESKWLAMNLRTKCTFLADFRMRKHYNKKFGGIQKPADFDINPTQYTFCAILSRLIGGDGLNVNATHLFFQYDTPFHRFEKILQDETRLCYIPPQDSPSLGSSIMSLSTPRTSQIPASVALSLSALQSTSTPALNTSVTSISATSITTNTSSELDTIWAKRFQLPSRQEKGYQLKDGPWKCRIGSKFPSLARLETMVDICGKSSYERVVSRIMDYNKKYPNNEHYMLIMHSKEREVSEMARDRKHADERDLRERMMALPFGDREEEDNYEETYFEWLCRTKKI